MKIASVIVMALLIFAGIALMISAQLRENRLLAVLGTVCFLVALAIVVTLPRMTSILALFFDPI
jgi:hypothetical protein